MNASYPVQSIALVTLILALAFSPARAADPPTPAQIAALIDKLRDVADGDVGYSASVTGSSFTPLDTEADISTALLFQNPPVRSETLRQLVKHGLTALPHLIAHLDDKRPTRIKVRHAGGIGGLWFSDGMDSNERTDKPVPVKDDDKPDDERTISHTLTVGDLCFVAIGQVVNRHFNAVRYQPTAIIIVSSPTRSAALRKAVRQAWGSLTHEQHRAALAADFLKPDYEERRIGACKRLAYYYPDALEPLALKLVAQPTYDVFDIEKFVRKQLYRAKDDKEARSLFDAYLAKHGEPARDGILLQLFDDLDTLEANEEKRLSPPLKEFSDQPRKLLILLYGKDRGVKSKDRPHVDALSATEKVRVIGEGLVYDRSAKLDRAVRDLLASIQDDDYLALACMKRLLGRGYDPDIEKYCRRRLRELQDQREKDDLQVLLDKVGWTGLHVAVERNDLDAMAELVRDKALLDRAAKNGQTPLHLAARGGNLEAVRLLVGAKASLDPKDGAGRTPAQLAVRDDHLDVVGFLAGQGCASPDVLVAASAGNTDRLRDLLRQDATVVRETTKAGLTPLHLAAHFGHANAAERLLEGGAKVEAATEEGLTALHVAAGSGQEAVARVLLRFKANVRAVQGETGVEPLHLAAYHRHAKAAEVLLDAKAAVDAKVEETGGTPLHLAAGQGHAGVVDVLLKRKAAVDVADKQGRTPLHRAAANNQVEAAERLLAGKAAVNAKDEYEATPLHLAVEEGHEAVVRVLLAAKADRAAKDAREQTPLDIARRQKDAPIIKLLEDKSGKP